MAAILIVEDDPTNAQIAAIICRRAGHCVTTAASMAEALIMLAGVKTFEAVLLDVRLPDGSGIDLAASIKGSPRHASVAVVGITALVDPHTRSALLCAGAYDVIHKPYTIDQLSSVLSRCVSSSPLNERGIP